MDDQTYEGDINFFMRRSHGGFIRPSRKVGKFRVEKMYMNWLKQKIKNISDGFTYRCFDGDKKLNNQRGKCNE